MAEDTENKKIELNLDFEKIVPWNGQQDTGRDVRLKLDRNWQKVSDAFNTVLEFMVGGEYLESHYLRKDKDDSTPYRLGVGALDFRDNPINRFIRFFDEEKPEEVSDADIYSALMVDERIKEGNKELDERYLRKDKEDTAHKHITFEEGITVYQLAKMMNIEVEQLATLARAIVQVIGSSTFVDGFFGEGWQIWKAIATGDWHFTIDRLTVRKVMTIFELIIQKIRSVRGMIVVSAGNGKIKTIEKVGLEYKFTFEAENNFMVNDLIRCQTWNGGQVKYYWVEIVRVDGQNIFTRISDYAGVKPEVGDEVVLMGNTSNKLRQGIVLISAAEDGQPRVDVLYGVHTTNLDGCLKTRLGSLDGITDSRFPSDMQPKGYGIYGNNCYLTGVFVLSNGKDVQTQFSIMEGQIRSSLASVQQQVNAEDNYLSNASFTADMDKWQYGNDVRAFHTSGGLLHLNNSLYTEKKKFAGIVVEEGKNVLRIIDSYICQKNEDYALQPEFAEVEQTITDETGNEVGTGVMLYRPRMFYVSFKYRVAKRGLLKIYFEEEVLKADFETYESLHYEKELDMSSAFDTFEWAAKWNGTGNFRLEFTGEIFLYDVALADDRLADMEERWSSQLEITEKKILTNLAQTNANLETYHAEFLLTAQGIRADLLAAINDTKSGLVSDYTSRISASAQSLSSDYNAQISNLKTGDIATMKSSISQQANQISTKVSQTDFNALNQTVSSHSTQITQNKNQISAVASSIKTDSSGNITNISKSGLVLSSDFASLFSTQVSSQGIVKTASLSSYVAKTELGDLVSKIDISADQINLTGKVTFNDLASGVQSTINGKVNSSTIISGNYIKTSLINVDELEVMKFKATSSGYTYALDSNGFNITNSSGTNLCGLYVNNYFGYFRMLKSSSEYFSMDATSLMYMSSKGLATLSGAGLALTSGAAITGFTVGNIHSSVASSSDFVVMSSNSSLPSPSSCKGKVIFVRFVGKRTLSGSIIPRNNASSVSSVEHENKSAFYISNGSYWYEFFCYYG